MWDQQLEYTEKIARGSFAQALAIAESLEAADLYLHVHPSEWHD